MVQNSIFVGWVVADLTESGDRGSQRHVLRCLPG
jgi:hypothetical protein